MQTKHRNTNKVSINKSSLLSSYHIISQIIVIPIIDINTGY